MLLKGHNKNWRSHTGGKVVPVCWLQCVLARMCHIKPTRRAHLSGYFIKPHLPSPMPRDLQMKTNWQKTIRSLFLSQQACSLWYIYTAISRCVLYMTVLKLLKESNDSDPENLSTLLPIILLGQVHNWLSLFPPPFAYLLRALVQCWPLARHNTLHNRECMPSLSCEPGPRAPVEDCTKMCCGSRIPFGILPVQGRWILVTATVLWAAICISTFTRMFTVMRWQLH